MHISVTFLLITFFGCIFSKLFQLIRILRFLIPKLNFWIKKIFSALISTFCTLRLQMRRKRSKKTENLFLWMCLRILLGNHQRVCITKLLKSLYPSDHGDTKKTRLRIREQQALLQISCVSTLAKTFPRSYASFFYYYPWFDKRERFFAFIT